MEYKKTGSQQDRQSEAQHEDINNLRIHQKIRSLLLNGGCFTASELNRICGGNDARKVISLLRNKELLNIRDIRLKGGRKLYWYSPITKKGGAI